MFDGTKIYYNMIVKYKYEAYLLYTILLSADMLKLAVSNMAP